MNALRLISALCLFGSVTLLVMWLYREATAAYRTGQGALGQLQMNPQVEITAAPNIARASRAGIVFVPFINQLATANRFGIHRTLAHWQRQLLRAGWGNAITPTQLMSASLSAGITLGALAALIFLLWGAGLMGAALVGFPAGALAGFFLPSFLTKNVATDRVALIEKRLPFAIEFMLLAMEANAAFIGALRVYCDQMKSDPLADEFRIATSEVERGLGLEGSLARLVERIESDSLSNFVLAITTGIETGQPIKAVLKVQADAARQRRYEAAEVLAKSAGTRAVFPLFLVMIAVLLLLVAPMILKVMHGGTF